MGRKPSERARRPVLVASCLSFHAVRAASCENVGVAVSGYYRNVYAACSGGSAYATSYATRAREPAAGPYDARRLSPTGQIQPAHIYAR